MLTEYGLKPNHTLLDVGCGCLRGGVHFVRYLDPGTTGPTTPVAACGLYVELAQAGLQDRLPRTSLRSDDAFDFTGFGVRFDRAIAFSLFTHLPLNAIRICLERMADVVKPGGVFHATFFELPEGESSGKDIRHPPADVLTHGAADPYHHRVADFRHAVEGLPWEVRYVGKTKHPRGQRLVNFVRRALPGEVAGETRTLSVGDAKSLHAGSSHYRSLLSVRPGASTS